MTDLRSLLPEWAKLTDELDYGAVFGEPCLYHALHEDGSLKAVGIVESGAGASWFTDRGRQHIMCRSVITLHPSGASGFSRGVTSGVHYQPDGTLRSVNGYNEDDLIEPAAQSFAEWAAADIEAKVRYATARRSS